jgi:hypothetical protein
MDIDAGLFVYAGALQRRQGERCHHRQAFRRRAVRYSRRSGNPYDGHTLATVRRRPVGCAMSHHVLYHFVQQS